MKVKGTAFFSFVQYKSPIKKLESEELVFVCLFSLLVICALELHTVTG